ncbi:MAG: hypothetical protein JNJ85_15120 [Candidatus Kapabacteria bacterium]|nr:hypothetical protein [Candidatus Kapabacteria bacterium]
MFRYLLIVICYTISIQAQVVSPEVQYVANKLQEQYTFRLLFSGYNDTTALEQLQLLDVLEKKASEEELLTLTQSPYPVVQAMSSVALVDRQYPAIIPLFTKYIEKKNRVRTSFCITIYQLLASLLYQRVSDNLQKFKGEPILSTFYKSLLASMDSTILQLYIGPTDLYTSNTDIQFSLLYDYLSQHKGQSGFATVLRGLISKNNRTDVNCILLQELAGQKDIKDSTLLIDNAATCILPLGISPNICYQNTIERLLNERILKNQNLFDFIQVIAPYRNIWSELLLRKIALKLSESEISYFASIVSKEYTPLYHDLLIELFVKHKVVSSLGLRQLLSDLRANDKKLYRKALLKHSPITLDYGNDTNRDDVLVQLTELVGAKNKRYLTAICNVNILKSGFYLESFITVVKKHQLRECLPVLLKRLHELRPIQIPAAEKDPDIAVVVDSVDLDTNQTTPLSQQELYMISDGLFSFNKDTVNRIVLKRLLQLQRYWDSNKEYSAKFRALFKAYKLRYVENKNKSTYRIQYDTNPCYSF